MSNNLIVLIIYVMFFATISFLVFWFLNYGRKRRKEKKIADAKFEDFKEEYSMLTSEKIDALKDEELVTAVIVSVNKKEEENEEDYFNLLNEVEKTVYGIYLIGQSLNSSTGLRSFFLTPSNDMFIPIIDQLFLNANGHELANLLKSARRLNEIMENNEEDDEDMEDYSTYNFSDFTNEYRSLFISSNFQVKLNNYIRENKDLFKGDKIDEISE